MKKIIPAAAILAYSLLLSLNGDAQNKNEIPRVVKQSFDKNFQYTKIVQWAQVKEAFVATIYNDKGQIEQAYFTSDGEFEGKGRWLELNALPINIQRVLTDRYAGLNVVETYEYNCNTNGPSYYAILVNSKNKVIVRMDPYGQVLYNKKSQLRDNSNSLAVDMNQ